MKKLLGIVVLGLLLCGNAYAGCNEDLDRSWQWEMNKQWMKWTIKNKSNKDIIIARVGLKAKDGTIMREEKPYDKPYVEGQSYPIGEEDFYLKPYGVTTKLIFVGDLNLDVAGTGYTACRYGTRPVVQKSKPTIKQPKTNTNNTEWKGGVVVKAGIVVLSFIILIIVGCMYFLKSVSIKDKKKEITQNKKLKSSKHNDTGIVSGSSNFVETVWNGEESMAKTFWLYCILIVAIVSFISGLVIPSFGNIIWLIPISVIIWSNTGLWRSSSFYQNQRLKTKQPYGWATAAKVYVILNYIVTLSQIGLSLNV